MRYAENFRWAWRAAWLNNGARVDDYRQLFSEASRAHHKRQYLRWQTQHLIELDRLAVIRPKLSP